VIKDWHRAHAAKRGGGQPLLPLEFDGAESRLGGEPIDPRFTPEQAYDHHWAREMIERAIAGLRADYGKSGRGDIFAALAPLLLEVVSDETVARNRMRRRLGERLRAEVAETVADANDVDVELQHLIAAVGARRA
jgi:hypothetical protein